MRGLRSEIHHALKQTPGRFQWPIHAALLRKLSKVVDVKSEVTGSTVEMNGNHDSVSLPRKNITLVDVSINTTKSLTEDKSPEELSVDNLINNCTVKKSPEKQAKPEENNVVIENVTVEIQHNITPKKSSLKLDLKKGTSQLSASLLNISSQIKSVTTHKRIISMTGPKKSQARKEKMKEEADLSQSTPKSAKSSRPLVNTKSPNVLIYSDSIAARDNLEASLRKVLDCDRYVKLSIIFI